MRQLTTEALSASYVEALALDNPKTDALTVGQFSCDWVDVPDWAVGPFVRDDSLTFVQHEDWPDPTGIGWRDTFLFNPTTIEHEGRLHLIYRASPRKESLGSRVGHAVFEDGVGWAELPSPVLYPTLDNELLGCEDPKLYRANGRFFLFYNGIWPAHETDELDQYGDAGYPIASVGCDINLAVSDDLEHWEKLGRVVPHEVSRLWAKGAVIPRNADGEAVMINGDYLMFVSEGCGGQQTIGRSQDMINWTFEPQQFLDLTDLEGSLYEVACAITGHDGDTLVLDFFYADRDGEFAAAQALYTTGDPFTQLDMHAGGSLAWGGLMRFGGTWLFA